MADYFKDLDLSKLDLTKFKNDPLGGGGRLMESRFPYEREEFTPDPAAVERHRLDHEQARNAARETGGYGVTSGGCIYDRDGNMLTSSFSTHIDAVRLMIERANRAVQEETKG